MQRLVQQGGPRAVAGSGASLREVPGFFHVRNEGEPVNLRLTWSSPIFFFPVTSLVADCVNSMNVSGMAVVVPFFDQGRDRGNPVDSTAWAPPLALATWTDLSRGPQCSRMGAVSRGVDDRSAGVFALVPQLWQMDLVDSLPARFYKETGPESSEDEFGILEDDRCIDTGVFQPRHLVHEPLTCCSCAIATSRT